jgi:four helix bundle protein
MAGAYKQLRAWRQAVELVLDIYRATNSFPKTEVYGLSSQMRQQLAKTINALLGVLKTAEVTEDRKTQERSTAKCHVAATS